MYVSILYNLIQYKQGNRNISYNLFYLIEIFLDKSYGTTTEYNLKRMTTFIKTKFNKSDDQTNIDNIE